MKTPWEDRETSGFFGGIFRTLRDALFTPSEFFRNMSITGGLTDPLLYALIVGMVGIMSHYFWSILLYDSMQHFMTPELRAAAGNNLIGTRGASIATAMTPFLLMFWLFIVSGLLHVILLLLNGARAGFEATFRVISYSVSPFICLAIPWCGMPLTILWVATLSIIGIKEAQETSGGKAAVAVLFPLVLCCGLVLAAIALFMGAMVASFGSLMHLYQ
jgi:hypothetical protein